MHVNCPRSRPRPPRSVPELICGSSGPCRASLAPGRWTDIAPSGLADNPQECPDRLSSEHSPARGSPSVPLCVLSCIRPKRHSAGTESLERTGSEDKPVCTCPNGPSCLIYGKVLILDTNALLCINRIVQEVLRRQDPTASVLERREQYLTETARLLAMLERCSGGKVKTSDLLYANEVDPRTASSMLRQADPVVRELCRDADFASSLHEVYRAVVGSGTRPAPSEGSLRLALPLTERGEERLSQADISLVSLALAEAEESDAIVLSDEVLLGDAIVEAHGQQVVRSDDGVYRSSRVHHFYTAQVIGLVHQCCKLESELYCCAAFAAYSHLVERLLSNEISLQTYEKHNSYIRPWMGNVQAAIRKKREDNEDRHWAREFGAEGG